MFHEKKRLIALSTLVLMAAQLLNPIFHEAYALNTTYYVDATSGSDVADGSLATPWQTLAGVSSHTFQEGDQILLKCGETWTDTLTLTGNAIGVTGNPVTIGTYGSCSSASIAHLSGSGAKISIGLGAENITISGLVLSNDAGVSIAGATGVTVAHNTFSSMGSYGVSLDSADQAVIDGNSFILLGTATGVTMNLATNTNITGNTFSGGLISLNMVNSSNTNITSNTFYSPSTVAVRAVEDTNVSQGTAINNALDGNTILTWNPSFPMVSIEDQNDAVDALLEVNSNQYVNVYKNADTLVEIIASGAATQYYNKTNITTLDTAGTTFGAFAYSSHLGNETRILVNTGSTSVNRACPGGICPEYVNTLNAAIVWPTSVPAYGSKIVLWNNSSNILRPPACTLTASPGGSIANGDPVTLSWTVTNSSGNTLTMPTATGGTTSTGVANIGSGVFYPPLDDQVNHYSLLATNNIGSTACTADITTQNNPPSPVTFTMNATEDGSGFTGVLQATDSSGDTIYFRLYPDNLAIPTHASGFTLDQITGEVVYTPNTNFCTDDTFEWRAMDQHGRYSDPTTGVIHVGCTNDTPVAIDDTLNATGGQLAILPVTINDADPDAIYQSQTYTVAAVTLPSHGTLVASGAVFEYTPDGLYMGADSFTYEVTDQSGATSNVGTVTLSVAPGMNLPPNVSSGSALGDEDTIITGTLSGSDLNGDTLTYNTSTPTHGTVTLSGAAFTYTPNANYNGSDSFDFTASDGIETSSSGTISITINSLSDAPSAIDDTVNVTMDTPTNIDVLVNDTDADNPYQPQTLTITGIVTAPTSGTATIVGNQIQYTPNSLFLGTDSLTYIIEDQDGNVSNTATVNISVTTTNQPPVAESGSYTLNEDIPVSATLSGSDPDGTPVSFVLDQNPTRGTVTLSSTGAFTYTPNPNANGSDSFTYHVSDGVFQSAIETISLTINPINDGPIANADSATITEDGSGDISPLLNDTDPENDTVSLQSITQGGHGTTTMSGDVVTYIPTANYCGSDTFQYIAQDQGAVQSAVGTVTVTITCVNDAPTTTNTAYSMIGNVLFDSGHVLTQVFPATDIDGDVLSYTITQTGANGTLTASGNTFHYTPNIDYTGTDSFSFIASDGSLTSNTGTVTITVLTNTHNNPPIAASGSFTTNEDTPIAGSLTGSDPEGAPITFVLDQNPTRGTVTLSATGAFTYTPNPNANGSDFFTYHVSDGIVNSAIETVSITVVSINDAPMAQDDSVTTLENTPVNFNPVTNDTDVDGDVLVFFNFTSPAHGTATASGNVVTYTPTPFWCGTDTVTYMVADTAAALSNTGTVTLSVSCVNQSPVGNPDALVATEDTPTIITVLANDTDPDGDTLIITNLTQPSVGGTAQVTGNSITYTPTANFCTMNPITFTYRARDPSGALSAVTSVTISSVACVNDTPTANSLNFSLIGNEVIASGTVLSGGTLTGYIESNNVFSGVLSSVDVDGDVVTYTGINLPTHGTLILDVNGNFSYRPNAGYYGTDTFSYMVSDGVVSSSPAVVTLSIQNPRPPVVGPGGGSAGGSATNGYVSTYTEVTTLNSTGNTLTSQLYLGSPVLSGSSRTLSGEKLTLSSANTGALLAAYEVLIEPIRAVVEDAKADQVSSGVRSLQIRQEGQRLLHSIRKSIILSKIEKKQAIQASTENIKLLKTTGNIPQRELKAINFIIRLFTREQALIQKGIATVQSLLN